VRVDRNATGWEATLTDPTDSTLTATKLDGDIWRTQDPWLRLNYTGEIVPEVAELLDRHTRGG
jgi:hypothetical protein